MCGIDLDFGKSLFNGLEIRRIWRQVLDTNT
jgi:hypothetical protein